MQNIIFSITVILILILSNLFQLINLPLGVVGHEGSTILVILNSLRLLAEIPTHHFQGTAKPAGKTSNPTQVPCPKNNLTDTTDL